MHVRQTLGAVASVVTAIGMIFASPTASLGSMNVAEPVATDSTQIITETIPFTGAVRLGDALRLAQKQSDKTVAYRFENPQVVGEYFVDADVTPDAFVESFLARFQTEPQFVAVVVEKPEATSDTEPSMKAIETGLPAFQAPLVPSEVLESRFATLHSAQQETRATTSGSLVASEWRPPIISATTMRSGTHQYFDNQFNWNNVVNVPGSFGAEMQIDISNSAVGVRGSILPWELCSLNFRDNFIAKNYGINSWFAANQWGSMPAAFPYIDLNDLGDSCGRSSMAVGFASPQDMTVSAGINDVETFIDAKIGNAFSSPISGTLQLVNSASCPFDGSIAYTDCMGIPNTAPPGVPGERKTLNADRGWVAAPNKCWVSYDYGTTAPVAQAC